MTTQPLIRKRGIRRQLGLIGVPQKIPPEIALGVSPVAHLIDRIPGSRRIEQNRLYAAMKAAKPPQPKPFAVKPLINLVYHLWPVKGQWQWHAERLDDLISLCDGRVIVGIATDDSTDDAGDVMQRIGNRPEYILSDNITEGNLAARGKRYGELLTAIPAWNRLRDTGDSITIYAHAKGMRPHTRHSQAVRLWTEMMYETVAFNLRQTVDLMQAGYDCVGSFRTFGTHHLFQRAWHYSGTFYNVRTQAMLLPDGSAKPFQLKYGGTEAWVSDHIPAAHSANVFADNSPWLRQYSTDHMDNLIPDHLRWQSAQWQGVEMEQHKREFEWLVDQLTGVRSLLVIGSRHGGIEHHLRLRYPGLQIVSVDLDPLPDNTQECLILGDSHNFDVQSEIRNRGPYDAVFIDGDHTYEGVRLDWEFALSLNPRRICFHDHTHAVYHQRCGCEVDRLWAEIRAAGYHTTEKVVGCGWGGIGLVRLRGTQ